MTSIYVSAGIWFWWLLLVLLLSRSNPLHEKNHFRDLQEEKLNLTFAEKYEFADIPSSSSFSSSLEGH
jgi:hypothetical protein